MELFVKIIGILGILYWIATLYVVIFKPVIRDRCLVDGFTKYILTLVILTPFALGFLFSQSRYILSQRELVYTPDLYKVPGNSLPDSVKDRQEDPSLLWTVYYLMIDPGNQHMTTSRQGRVVGVVMGITGVFLLNGLLVSTLVSLFDRRKSKWLSGQVRYRRLRNHTVIIGGNRTATGIICQTASRKGYLLIVTDQDVEAYRKEIYSLLPKALHKKIILYYGKRDSALDMQSLCIRDALEIFIIGEGNCMQASSQDTLNLTCLSLLASNLPPQSKTPCRVMFLSRSIFSTFQYSQISDSIKDRVDFRPFCFYEQWARNVLVQRPGAAASAPYGPYLPLEGSEGLRPDDPDRVHLILLGISRMSSALAIEAAHLAHYPNFATKGIYSRITFIDKDIDTAAEQFRNSFRGLFELSKWRESAIGMVEEARWHQPQHAAHLGEDTTDIEWEFLRGGFDSPDTLNYLRSALQQEHSRVTVAICLPDQEEAAAVAMHLPDQVSLKAMQILVWQPEGASIIDSISRGDIHNTLYSKTLPFGMEENCWIEASVLDAEKRSADFSAIYARAYEKVNAGLQERPKTAYSGRGKSAAARQWSNLYNANSVWTKIRSFMDPQGRLQDRDKLLARTEHNRWSMEQLLMRYRPLTEEEQAAVLTGSLDKEQLKCEQMAHLDICSWDRLKEVDPTVIFYDEALTEILPEVYNAQVS